jgi:hypothetical protein
MVEIKDPKTFTYKVGEDVYDIPEDTVDVFLKDNPNAKLFEEEVVKENGVVETDASVTPEINTASISDPGSSVSTDPDPKTLYKDYSSAIAITEEEEISLNEPIDFTIQGTSAELQPYNPETGNDLIKSQMESNYRDPETGKVFKTNELVYKTQKDEDGNLINQPFIPYIEQLSEAKEMLMNPLKFGIDAEPIVEPTADQVEALAEVNIKNTARQNLIKSKAKTFLNDLSTEERESLIPYKVDEIIAKDSKFKAAIEEYKVVNDSYANSTNLFNLKSISSKFNNPDYKFDLEGLGDYKQVELLEQRIKDLKDPRYLPTQASVDLYNNLVNVYEQELANLQTVKLGNGKIVPKSTFDLYKSLVKENETVINTLNGLFDEIETLPAEIKDGKSELDFLKKEYSFSKKMLEEVQANIGIAAIDATGGAARILGDFAKLVYGVETPSLTEFSEFTEKLTQTRKQQIQEKYAIEPVTFDNAFDSFENMGTFITQETIGQAGILAMLATGKIPGFSGIGLGSYEQQRRVLEQEEKATGIEQSPLHKAGVALGFAALEVGLGAAPTFSIFNRGFKVAEEVGKRTLANVGVGQYIMNRIGAGVYDSLLESGTESLTVLGQNGIDVLRGAKNSGDIFKGVDHAAFTGGVLGVQFSAMPTLAGLALKPFSDYNTSKSVRDKIKERNELYNIGYGNKGEIGLDKRTKSFKIINEKINQLDGDIYNLVSGLERKVSANLTPIGFELFANATSEQEALRVEAENIIQDFDNGKISLKQKNTILKDLKIDFDALQVARNQFRNDYTVNIDLIDKKEKARYLDQAKKELESEGASIKPLDIKKRAEKLWQVETFNKNIEKDKKVLRSLKGEGISASYKVSETKADAIKDFTEALNKRVADPNNNLTEEQAKKAIDNFTKGINRGSVNGSNFLTETKDGKKVYDIIIAEENALANGKTLTGTHEIGHILFTEGISKSPIAFIPMAKTIIDYLAKNNQPAYRRLMQRVGPQIKAGNFDEVLTEFLEEIPRMNLEAENNKGLLAIIAQGINPALKKATGETSGFNLKGSVDIIEFLTTLSTKLSKGELKVDDIKAIQDSDLKVKDTIKEPTQKLSESDSIAVQTIFEEKGKDGAFEIIEKFKPITNKLVQRRSEAPSFDRQLLTDEIETGKRGIIDLINEYDASKGVPLAAYINKYLPSRAIEASNRVLDTEFKLDVTEAKSVTDTTTEEITERVAEKPTKAKESLRKKIKLDKATTQKVVDAVTKTFGTKLPPVDSPQFKKALQKGFRTELKTIMAKDVLGSRSAYETFLRDNFENIYEAIPQDVINKRFRQFAEDTGKREKTKEGKKIFKKKNIAKAEFINYFLGRDVGTSTKGTRKDALAEALAEEFAFDATMETIQKPEIIEKREFVDKTQTTEKVSKAIDRDVDFKFSETLTNKNGTGILDRPTFELETKGAGALLQSYNDKNGNPLQIDDLTTKTGVDNYVENLDIFVLPIGPKAFFFGKTGSVFTPSSRIAFPDKTSIKNKLNGTVNKKGEVVIKKETDPAKIKILKQRLKNGDAHAKYYKAQINTLRNSNNFGNEIDGIDNYTRPPYKTAFGNSAAQIKAKNDNGDIEKFNNKHGKIHKVVWERINKQIADNKSSAIPIASFLKLVGNDTKHFHRLGAEMVGWSTNPKGNGKKLYEWEHAMPATAAYLYLLDVSLSGGNFKAAYRAVMDNYKLIALDASMDAKLKTAGLTTRMPKGWNLAENSWWQRYFNDQVSAIKGGINPESLMFTNDRTFGDQLGINSQGNPTTPALRNSESQAKIFNEKLLPKNIKFSKSDTNQNVITEMERLDKEAQDARLKLSESQDLNKDFNEIIERATGIGREKQYGQTKARAVGADKGRFNLLGIPPSAQDFVGLTRYFAGKGKQGDKTIAWVKENFLDPFARANIDISNARVALANDFKALKKLLGVSPKDLNKKIIGEPYTVGNAVRVYTWGLQGITVPGLSKADQKILEDYVLADENLQLFANELIAINKDNGYPKPTDGWLAGTITTDLLSGLNTVVRAKYLKQWQGNVNEVFNETNLNKLEAAYGKSYREALENILGRMKSGSNRGAMGDTLTGRFVDWLNGSIGAIMFFNMRSAVLQTISAVNFVNWSDNNPLKAAAAFGNQPQYWSDVIKLMNSDYLIERRNGLKINVNEADIAEIAAESKNKAKAFISKLLKLGFLPTQIADSFAIASGGATFYRNRYKSLKKEGLSDKDAEAQAFQDFREIAEESQQSSRPDRISAQQAGPMGRVILAFANTPAQYARLMQKAASDLKNRRGDDKTNISKIIYYGAIQNVIFNALQQALFAMAFGDEEPDEEKKNKKYTGIVNGMSDSLLRGLGFHGAAISTLKNAVMKLAEGKEAQDAAIELLDISPPISSKIGKLKSAGRTWDWNKKEIMEKGWSLDNPAYLAAGQVVSAATNVPLDRGIRKLQNLKDASDAENEEWMRIANALGWAKWELEWQKDKPKKKLKSNKRTSKRTSTRTSSRTKKR